MHRTGSKPRNRGRFTQALRACAAFAQTFRVAVASRSRQAGLPFAARNGVSSPSRPKVLVVYFSRTGTTRHLADSIARAAHGDLEELRERRSRRGPIGWLRSGFEGTYRLSAETLPLAHDLGAYDLVFVGSPTWNRALSSPVRGFLERSGATLKSVVLFATCAERGADDVIAQMSRLLPQPPLATLTMLERDVKRGPAVWVGETVEAAFSALGHARAAGAHRSAG